MIVCPNRLAAESPAGRRPHTPVYSRPMLKQRLIVGLIIAALFVGLIWLDSYASGGWPLAAWSTPPGLMVALVSIIAIPLGLWEMRGLLAKENVTISLRITTLAAILCMIWPWLEEVAKRIQEQHADVLLQPRIEASPWYTVGRLFHSVKPEYLVPTVLAFSLVAAVIKHARHHRVEGTMANAGGTLLAVVYLGVLPGFYLPICMTHSAWMVLAIVGIVKAADIGAYTVGRLFGKHKLIEWLSPKKTIEGFFGGLALSGIVGACVAAGFQNHGGPAWTQFSVATVLTGGAHRGRGARRNRPAW